MVALNRAIKSACCWILRRLNGESAYLFPRGTAEIIVNCRHAMRNIRAQFPAESDAWIRARVVDFARSKFPHTDDVWVHLAAAIAFCYPDD